jgi:hypothetical protein
MEAAMSNEKRFNFLGADADHEDQISMRVDLGEAPTFQRLQRLFEDLFVQRRLRPGYLFMAKHDHDKLSHDIAVESGMDTERSIVQIANYSGGRLVHVITLPDLSPGRVIIGFFR